MLSLVFLNSSIERHWSKGNLNRLLKENLRIKTRDLKFSLVGTKIFSDKKCAPAVYVELAWTLRKVDRTYLILKKKSPKHGIAEQ